MIRTWAGVYRQRQLDRMEEMLERFNWQDKYEGTLAVLRTVESVEEAAALTQMAAARLRVPAPELWLDGIWRNRDQRRILASGKARSIVPAAS